MENLSIICGGLGTIEEDNDQNQIGYTPGEYCLDNLKDLLRFLRRDDPETREVFKQVCKWNIVGKDILQIIQYCQNDTSLVLNAVKVLVFLTMPVDPTSKDIPQQIEYLWGLKSLITSSHAIPVIVTLLESPLEHLEGDLFTDDDWKLVQLVVTLFRNILAVQDITSQQRAAGLASEFILLRDRFLELLFEENVMDLILVLTQHVGGSSCIFRQDNLLLLETFYYIYKGQVPELIARAHLDANVEVVGEAEATATDLKSIMEEEKAKRRQTMHLVARSKFSGSFTRVTMDGSKVLVKGNPCSDSHDSLLKGHKNPHASSKKTVWESGRMPTTNKNIVRLLYDYTDQFLLGGYNVLMRSVREDIEKEHHGIENNDVVIFFQVAEFVMSFQNHKLLSSKPDVNASKSESSRNHDADSTLFKGNICGSISETMNESMFLLVISKWRSAFEGLKETNNYSFLSAAGSLTKTMIHMLDLVLKLSPEDSKEPQTARVLLYKLFYDQTDQGMTHFLFSLIKAFNAHKQPKSDLADLVETIHIVIRLMENLQSRGTLRVAKKARRKRKKKSVTTSKDANNADQVTVQKDDSVSGAEKTENVSTSIKEMPQGSSADKNGENDVVYGDDGVVHGDDGVIPEKSDQPDAANLEAQDTEHNMQQMENKSENTNATANDNDNDDSMSDASSDDEQQESTNEVDFKASSLVSSLANSTIIQNLCWLLKFYKSNSARTNHYIISALRRVCEDLELSPMLYQLSLLIIFHTILEEQKLSPCKEYDNIISFLTSLVRGMLKKMKSYPLLFVEVLFWKTRKECHYINCDSMIKDLGKMRNGYRKKGDDPPHADLGEAGTSGRSGWVRKSIADALGDDEADVVVPVWRDDDQSEDNSDEAQMQRTLKRGINEGNDTVEELNNEHPVQKNHERARKRLKPLVLDDALEQKLKDLYEKYKEFPDCSQRIVGELNMEVSPAQVSSKLKEMGFKLPSKRRVGDTNVSSVNGEAVEASAQRKRGRLFSEEQEIKIKTLFEQFKDKKKCCQMIASALDGDVTFTAAQVSRKLRQLGLRIRKQKSGDNMHLKDDGSDSDGETLLSLKKRNKRKQNIDPTDDTSDQNLDPLSDDSDDIVLSSAFRSKKKQNKVLAKETPEQNTDQLSDDSDNIVLSSAFRSKKKQSIVPTEETLDQNLDQPSDDSADIILSSAFRRKKKQNKVQTMETPDQNSGQLSDDSDNIVLTSAFRKGSKRLSLTKAQESRGDFHSKSEVETEAIKVGSGQEENVMMTENLDNMQDHELSDDLADDVGTNSSPVASQSAGGGSRRKLRMVIDPDDED
ncbi:hypothetical protein HanRHA438_Chr07g0300331 [Helianthus annuus]|uniref:Putative timeless family protein n=1 Tax=Helianthus annuus TaxID=4232 RepID=A0A251UUB4_HELAN|nr:protein timeless homolog isoform X1 [Helianthus annuus]KAF5798186.1 putative timeless protein [Helianthus annuus]KAJ0549815.1 hypothetical protein HanHA300_Chr07g0238281 [Helianthus annuus]KAJ0556330.1 hypothetical protein HanIR_Chr07g0312571 [Helianthus annuus]KAJ0562770.1 hypothetical protein HanHA89_Chr07g0255461 [Helianthus annuus]KAJ0730915.1 hypothetical protein HanOQP8_Chr07g0245911 [Helianthus annuus]